MIKLFAALVLMLSAGMVLSQPGGVIFHTNPKLPPRESLERIDLKLAWHAKVPVDGLRDGFFSLQLIQGRTFPLLLAQTFKGEVVAINAETGDILWRTPVGLPYTYMVPAGFNDQAIFVCRRDILYALDRDDGKHLLYTISESTKEQVFGFGLESDPSAAVMADDSFLFASFSNRLVRYALPDFRALLKLEAASQPAEAKRKSSPEPIRQWNFILPGIASQAAILYRNALAVTTEEGVVVTIDARNPNEEKAAVFSQFKAERGITAQVASDRSMIYVPSQDYFLYAIDTTTDRLAWRFAGQAPMVDPPTATDTDVFVKVSKGGMYRLDRASGDVKWQSNDAVKFLATNNQFVYARDRVDNLLVIDYLRGKTLATWDVREWNLSIANDWTDRILLASHDGQIICLRHRDNLRPLAIKMQQVLKIPEPIKIKGKENEKKDIDKNPKLDDKLPKDKGV